MTQNAWINFCNSCNVENHSLVCTFFSWLGMMQRTKFGLVFLSVVMRLPSCSLYSWPTVRNMPLRVLNAPCIESDIPATLSKPTIRSTVRTETVEQLFYQRVYRHWNDHEITLNHKNASLLPEVSGNSVQIVIFFCKMTLWINSLTVSPQVSSKFVSRLVEQSGHTLVQRIHVFHQPLVCFIVHLHQRRATFIMKNLKLSPNHYYFKLRLQCHVLWCMWQVLKFNV